MQVSATQIDVLLDHILRLWPRLRATAALPDDNASVNSSSTQQQQRDLTLIPQAMQAEEDLQFFLRQYRSFKSVTYV